VRQGSGANGQSSSVLAGGRRIVAYPDDSFRGSRLGAVESRAQIRKFERHTAEVRSGRARVSASSRASDDEKALGRIPNAWCSEEAPAPGRSRRREQVWEEPRKGIGLGATTNLSSTVRDETRDCAVYRPWTSVSSVVIKVSLLVQSQGSSRFQRRPQARRHLLRLSELTSSRLVEQSGYSSRHLRVIPDQLLRAWR
jgi:hypothetical protein